jgi:hypothetical protein
MFDRHPHAPFVAALFLGHQVEQVTAGGHPQIRFQLLLLR